MEGSIWNHLQGLAFSQSFYDLDGVKIRAIEAGQGEALIFLHGTGGHAEAYMKNMRAHAEHFHVYALDMPGHGYSDTPDIDYSMQHYVDFMLKFLDIAGIDKVHISGESLGASVAAWFAIQHPQRVHKIVLNTGTLLPPDEKGAIELNDLLERTRTASTALDRDSVRKRMSWLMLDEKDLSDELVEVRYQIYSQPGRAAVIRHIVEQSLGALLDPELQQQWYSADLLRKITCPTLVLWTRSNPGQSLKLAEESVSLIPDAELVVLKHSAHWPQWEEADAFNAAHIGFLL